MTEYGFEQKSFRSKSIVFLFIVLLLANLFLWGIALSPDLSGFAGVTYRPDLRVDFINVGQGDAILVRTPRGRNFLIDGGIQVPPAQARQEKRELVHRFLTDKGIRALDGVLVTHPHNDHVGGIVPVLRLFDVKQVWECGATLDTATYDDYVAWCERKRIPRLTARAGQTLDWGEELFIQVLHPEEAGKSQAFSDLNNNSVTLLLRYGKVNILLAGDIEEDSELEVLRFGSGISSQILKIPHHGSETSINLPFLQLVKPAVGIIQVGRNNPFHHPSRTMLALYQRMGIKVYRTDQHGTVTVLVGGKDPKDFRVEVDQGL